jgi:magnesium chelatase family protein
MDLTVPVAALPARELTGAPDGEPSSAIRARVIAARERQMSRDGLLNARLQGRALRERTRLDGRARRLFDRALTKLALSARGHDRVLRVARTIADLDASASVQADHVAEALQFRGE